MKTNTTQATPWIPWVAYTCLAAALLIGCGSPGTTAPQEPTPLLVYCGSASKTAMELLEASYEQTTGVELQVIYGGSGGLLSQLEMSARGDVYMPGSPDFMIKALRKGLVVEETVKTAAYLVPSIVTPRGNPAGIKTLEDLGRPGVRVGLANPQSVCLGLYSMEILAAAGLTDPVLANTVTLAASCSKTATLVAMNQVDAVIGWRVFEAWDPAKMEAVPIPPHRLPRLGTIPLAVATASKQPARARDFVDFASSAEATEIFIKAGYLPTLEAAQVFAPNATVGGEFTVSPATEQKLRKLGTDQ